MRWEEQEKKIISNYFDTNSKEELLNKLPKRSWQAILYQSKKQGFKKRKKELIKYCSSYSNYSKLLKDNYEAYYWIGFLLADGHFTSRAIVLGLHIKDIEHIIRFRNFIEYSGPSIENFIYRKYRNKVLFSSSDYKIIPKIKEKFNISQRKTYIPPKNLSWIEKINPDFYISLIIGFIDGDGCLGQARSSSGKMISSLRIGNYYTWENILKHMFIFLFKYFNIKKIPKKYISVKKTEVRISVTNQIILRELKKKAIQLKLPFMKRKWDKINENYESIDEKDAKIIPKIEKLLKLKMKKTEISKKLRIHRKLIYRLAKNGKIQLN